jgi:hypothetical protein
MWWNLKCASSSLLLHYLLKINRGYFLNSPCISASAMQLTLTLIPCFFISLVLWGFLGVMQTTLAVSYSTINLRTIFLQFFLHLLKYTLLFSIICPRAPVVQGVYESLMWCNYPLQVSTFCQQYKIDLAIKSPSDCYLLHSDTDSIQGWCNANYMKLDISKTMLHPFQRKRTYQSIIIHIINPLLRSMSSTKNFGIFLNSKPHSISGMYVHIITYINHICASIRLFHLGIQCQLMPTYWNTFSRSWQAIVLIISSIKSIIAILLPWST